MRIGSLVLVLAMASSASAQTPSMTRTVAITIDDLPFVTGDANHPMSARDASAAAAANRKLLDVLRKHHVPVTGFVIQKSVETLGVDAGTAILRGWTTRGFDLGNHSYAHPNFNEISITEMEDQIVRGEKTIGPLMQDAGKKVEFFRFPFNHTGDTKEKHDAVAAFLAQRGYKLAPCTIETEDWMFAEKYFQMRTRHDHASIQPLTKNYVAFTAAQVDYFARLNKQIFGYEPPEIMLIHDNQLNADTIDKILGIFESTGYRFVTLAQAESDAAYRTPETFITSYGPMWSYRWAKVRGIKVDGSLEPDPPQWVVNYGKAPENPPHTKFSDKPAPTAQ